MLTTVFSYCKNSYKFSEDERCILLMLLEFFKYEIPNGNGSYLAMLNLNDIEFTWSPTMLLNDDGVLGAWTFAYKDRVFVRPSENSERLQELIKHIDRFSKSQRTVIEELEVYADTLRNDSV